MGVFVLAILVGLDNLAVASGLGVLGLSRGRKRGFIASCFAFEALAPVVGLGIGLRLRTGLGTAAEWVGPICLASSACLVLNAVARRRAFQGLLDRPLAMLLIPLALSLDNLSAGVGLGTSGTDVALAAVLVGEISAALSATGLALGERLRPRTARFAGLFAGAWLLGCAALSLLVDLA